MSGKEKLDWYTFAVLETGFEQIAYIYIHRPLIPQYPVISYNIPLIIIRHISHENSTCHPPVARCTLRIHLVFFSKGRFFTTSLKSFRAPTSLIATQSKYLYHLVVTNIAMENHHF